MLNNFDGISCCDTSYKRTAADLGPILLTWFNFNPNMD